VSQLWDSMTSNGVYVPKQVAVCPECGGELTARATEWVAGTRQPTESGVEIDCLADMEREFEHRYWQSDWQPVRDAITKWCKARSLREKTS
jgi:hypothetical protein